MIDLSIKQWKRYPLYKDSGIDWFGEIPAHWEIGKIIRFTEIKTGGTPQKDNVEYWRNGTIKWMTSGEVNKKIIYDTEKSITLKGLQNSNANILPINSVMIALSGQGKTKGTVGILKVEACCSQSLAAFICDQLRLYYLYLYYYLDSKYRQIRGLVGDNLRDGLCLNILKSIYLPLPPLLEQQQIAEYLDRETTKIDNLIAKTKTSIEKLKEYRTALISAVVTGKVDIRENGSLE